MHRIGVGFCALTLLPEGSDQAFLTKPFSEPFGADFLIVRAHCLQNVINNYFECAKLIYA